MSEWELSKFKDHFSIGLRNGLNKPSRVRGSGVRMVNMKEIFGYDFIDDKTPMELVPVSEKEFQSSNLEYGDLLFARQSLTEAGAGKVAIYRGIQPAVFESHLIRCRINKQKSDPTFLYYLFKSPLGKGAVSTIVHQVAAAGIKGSDLQELEFQFPEIQEQKAIASVLSSLDDKIDLLHRQNTTLEAMAETLFRQWFVEEAQEDWEERPLKEVCLINNGYAFQSETYKETGQKIIRTMNFNNHWIEFNNLVYILEDLAKSFDKYYLKRNDFLLVMVGASLGNFAIVTDDVIPSLQNQNMWCFRAHESTHQHYLNFAMRNIINDALHGASGSAREFFQKGVFYEIKIPTPPNELILKFHEISESYFSKIELNRKQIQTLEKLRDNLLPKLMSGEVRVGL